MSKKKTIILGIAALILLLGSGCMNEEVEIKKPDISKFSDTSKSAEVSELGNDLIDLDQEDDSGLSSDLIFYVDPGYRMNHAAQVLVYSVDSNGEYQIYDNKHGSRIALSYKDTTIDQEDIESHVNPTKVAISTDAYNFDEGIEFNFINRPGILMPKKTNSGSSIYRKYTLSKGGMFSSTSTDGGKTYRLDDGFRYELRESDKDPGYYDVFTNDLDEVILIYIGALASDNSNVRMAISKDNGLTFDLVDENPLGDIDIAKEGLNQRDPRATMLSSGDIRLFTMVQGGPGGAIPGKRAVGAIYSFTSIDGGHTWIKDDGVRLKPEDISEFEVWSLNDPHVIELSNGIFRMFVTANIEDEENPGTYKAVLISATTE